MFSVSWQVEVDVEQNFSDGLHIFTQGSYSSPMEIIIERMAELYETNLTTGSYNTNGIFM